LRRGAFDKALYEKLSISGKVLWNEMSHFRVLDGYASQLGATLGNAIANTGVFFPPPKKD
jgi:hypothetical protein